MAAAGRRELSGSNGAARTAGGGSPVERQDAGDAEDMCRRPTPHPRDRPPAGREKKRRRRVPHKRHIDAIWEVNPPQKKEALYPVFRLRDVIHASATDEGDNIF
uniref:Uncharacterized protein n=1 Tax=Oryza sativa subsp. japonica TaxID=39947 RepID=Q2QUP9_ORYSJ|nr:hypothetical protein LOC_Os12g15510 [Oryza sativa Japonica Group]